LDLLHSTLPEMKQDENENKNKTKEKKKENKQTKTKNKTKERAELIEAKTFREQKKTI
jgi:hypothetical protein